MKRVIGLTAAALMSASMLAAPAFAQAEMESGTMKDRGPGKETMSPATNDASPATDGATMQDDSAIDSGTTAAIAPTFDGALSAIGGNSASASAIGGMSEVDTVNVVSVGELEGHDATALDQAVTDNSAGIEELRSAIQANAAVSEKLETQDVDKSQIVAAQVNADGTLTFFVM